MNNYISRDGAKQPVFGLSNAAPEWQAKLSKRKPGTDATCPLEGFVRPFTVGSKLILRDTA